MAKVVTILNGIPKLQDEASALAIYDVDYEVGVGGLAQGSPLTLPSSKTYTDAELEIYLNGQRLIVSRDYNYVGTAPRTQVSFTFDLMRYDLVRFRIDRAP